MPVEVQQNRIRRHFSILDVATAIVIVLTVYALVKPGGALRTSVDDWRRTRSLTNATERHWDELARNATKLSSFEGPPDLIEFMDYECPFCREFSPVVDSAIAAGARIGIIHLPLKIHEQARPAALAALCADVQGIFPEVHKRLMNDESWMTLARGRSDSSSVLNCVARLTDPDCPGQEVAARRLFAHLSLSDSLNIRATPMFVARGKVLTERPTPASLLLLGRVSQ